MTCMWDNRSRNEIERLPMWDHPFIDIGQDIPATHNLAYSIVDLDDPQIIDIGYMLFSLKRERKHTLDRT